eukprot:COSAG02_NODE_6397_length_3599_cov_8.635143_5_plen_64_part_00
MSLPTNQNLQFDTISRCREPICPHMLWASDGDNIRVELVSRFDLEIASEDEAAISGALKLGSA